MSRVIPLSRRLVAAMSALSMAFQAGCADAAASVWTERRRFLARRDAAPAAVLPAALAGGAALPAAERILRPLTAFPASAADLPPEGFRRHAALLAALPPAAGVVRRPDLPPGRDASRVVVHIQDVHGNPGAQGRIAAAVRSLMAASSQASAPGGFRLGLVALEGAFGPMDLSRYRVFPDRAALRAASGYLLAAGELSGPLQAALSEERALPSFAGVDDAALYGANVRAYTASVPRAAAARERLALNRAALERRKDAAFSPALRAFDRRVEAHHAGEAPLGEHAALLAAHVPPPPATAAFLEALALEKGLDFERVEAQRRLLIDRLAGALTPVQLDELARLSAAHRLGEVGAGAFYAGLRALCGRSGAPLADLPAMDAYVRYVLLADAIDGDALFRELPALEKACYARLARSPEENRLLLASRRARLAAKLVDFSLTPEEWAEYRALPAESGTEGLSSFEAFYERAHDRDEAMARRLLDAMDSAGADAAVLVAGGYHAPGIAERLKAAGVAVVAFTPRVDAVEDGTGSAYLSVFSREKTPLEKLFQGRRLFLAPLQLPASEPLQAKLAALAAAPAARAGDAGRGEALFRALMDGVTVRARAVGDRVSFLVGSPVRRLAAGVDVLFDSSGALAGVVEREVKTGALLAGLVGAAGWAASRLPGSAAVAAAVPLMALVALVFPLLLRAWWIGGRRVLFREAAFRPAAEDAAYAFLNAAFSMSVPPAPPEEGEGWAALIARASDPSLGPMRRAGAARKVTAGAPADVRRRMAGEILGRDPGLPPAMQAAVIAALSGDGSPDVLPLLERLNELVDLDGHVFRRLVRGWLRGDGSGLPRPAGVLAAAAARDRSWNFELGATILNHLEGRGDALEALAAVKDGPLSGERARSRAAKILERRERAGRGGERVRPAPAREPASAERREMEGLLGWALGASDGLERYWRPIQAALDGEPDRRAARMNAVKAAVAVTAEEAGLDPARIIESAKRKAYLTALARAVLDKPGGPERLRAALSSLGRRLALDPSGMTAGQKVLWMLRASETTGREGGVFENLDAWEEGGRSLARLPVDHRLEVLRLAILDAGARTAFLARFRNFRRRASPSGTPPERRDGGARAALRWTLSNPVLAPARRAEAFFYLAADLPFALTRDLILGLFAAAPQVPRPVAREAFHWLAAHPSPDSFRVLTLLLPRLPVVGKTFKAAVAKGLPTASPEALLAIARADRSGPFSVGEMALGRLARTPGGLRLMAEFAAAPPGGDGSDRARAAAASILRERRLHRTAPGPRPSREGRAGVHLVAALAGAAAFAGVSWLWPGALAFAAGLLAGRRLLGGGSEWGGKVLVLTAFPFLLGAGGVDATILAVLWIVGAWGGSMETVRRRASRLLAKMAFADALKELRLPADGLPSGEKRQVESALAYAVQMHTRAGSLGANLSFFLRTFRLSPETLSDVQRLKVLTAAVYAMRRESALPEVMRLVADRFSLHPEALEPERKLRLVSVVYRASRAGARKWAFVVDEVLPRRFALGPTEISALSVDERIRLLRATAIMAGGGTERAGALERVAGAFSESFALEPGRLDAAGRARLATAAAQVDMSGGEGLEVFRAVAGLFETVYGIARADMLRSSIGDRLALSTIAYGVALRKRKGLLLFISSAAAVEARAGLSRADVHGLPLKRKLSFIRLAYRLKGTAAARGEDEERIRRFIRRLSEASAKREAAPRTTPVSRPAAPAKPARPTPAAVPAPRTEPDATDDLIPAPPASGPEDADLVARIEAARRSIPWRSDPPHPELASLALDLGRLAREVDARRSAAVAEWYRSVVDALAGSMYARAGRLWDDGRGSEAEALLDAVLLAAGFYAPATALKNALSRDPILLVLKEGYRLSSRKTRAYRSPAAVKKRWPAHGWPLYVTGSAQDLPEVLSVVLPILKEDGVPHRVVNGRRHLESVAGRAVVVQTESAAQAAALARRLDEALWGRGLTGPAPMSSRPVGRSGLVFTDDGGADRPPSGTMLWLWRLLRRAGWRIDLDAYRPWAVPVEGGLVTAIGAALWWGLGAPVDRPDMFLAGTLGSFMLLHLLDLVLEQRRPEGFQEPEGVLSGEIAASSGIVGAALFPVGWGVLDPWPMAGLCLALFHLFHWLLNDRRFAFRASVLVIFSLMAGLESRDPAALAAGLGGLALYLLAFAPPRYAVSLVLDRLSFSAGKAVVAPGYVARFGGGLARWTGAHWALSAPEKWADGQSVFFRRLMASPPGDPAAWLMKALGFSYDRERRAFILPSADDLTGHVRRLRNRLFPEAARDEDAHPVFTYTGGERGLWSPVRAPVSRRSAQKLAVRGEVPISLLGNVSHEDYLPRVLGYALLPPEAWKSYTGMIGHLDGRARDLILQAMEALAFQLPTSLFLSQRPAGPPTGLFHLVRGPGGPDRAASDRVMAAVARSIREWAAVRADLGGSVPPRARPGLAAWLPARGDRLPAFLAKGAFAVFSALLLSGFTGGGAALAAWAAVLAAAAALRTAVARASWRRSRPLSAAESGRALKSLLDGEDPSAVLRRALPAARSWDLSRLDHRGLALARFGGAAAEGLAGPAYRQDFLAAVGPGRAGADVWGALSGAGPGGRHALAWVVGEGEDALAAARAMRERVESIGEARLRLVLAARDERVLEGLKAMAGPFTTVLARPVAADGRLDAEALGAQIGELWREEQVSVRLTMSPDVRLEMAPAALERLPLPAALKEALLLWLLAPLSPEDVARQIRIAQIVAQHA